MFSKSIFLFYSFFTLSVCEKFSYHEDSEKLLKIDDIFAQVYNTLKDTPGGEEAYKKMFDASTKIPSGILAGNFFDLGDYDECYGIQSGEIYGKYCLGTLQKLMSASLKNAHLFKNTEIRRSHFQLHPQPQLAGLGIDFMGYHFAICVPHNTTVENLPGFIKFSEDLCYSKKKETDLSAGAITTIVILSIFGALIVASTIFDIYLYYTDKKTPHELFIAFSFLTNGRKIMSTTTNQDQLLCLNGIKAISMMWVILGHEYSQVMNAPLSNVGYIQDWQKDPANMIINGATVSVDTFFVVGGLVTVYTFLKSMDKGVKFNVILFYIHRYLRLTPALAIMCLVHLFLLNSFGSGPIWKVVDVSLVKPCEKSWWSTLLYITNYVQKGSCVPQTWYLTVDMQLFVLSPLVLIPLFKWPIFGLATLGFLTVAGVVTPFAIAYGENLGNMMADPRYTTDYYIQTYTRFGPYVIGMILGYFVYQVKKSGWKLRLPKMQKTVLICALWLIALGGLTACVFAGYDLSQMDAKPDRWGNSLFTAFNRNAWSVALGLVIFLCVAGYGGPVNSFLSWPVFQFLTKLSYSMYLVHFAVITLRYSAMRSTYKFTNFNTMYNFWSDFIVTMFISLVLCLSFESPVIIIEKYLFKRDTPKPVDKKPQA